MTPRGVRPGSRVLRPRAEVIPAGALLLAVLAGGGPLAAQADGNWGDPVSPPVPVLVVPGWYNTAEALAGLRVRLHAAGWPVERIAAVTFRDPTGSNLDHAREIATAVALLKERTGAKKVDIIAHSMGGLATRVYLREHPGEVRRVAFLATPHHGTVVAYLAFGAGREEMIPGSPFLDSLNAGPPVPPGVRALTVRALLETHVLPPSSATLPGVPDVVVCCATHEGIKRDLEAFEAVRDFLLLGKEPKR